MSILLTNDDGIYAEGLRIMEKVLSNLDEVVTVAPEKEQSATSHRFTLHKPLRARPMGEKRWSLSGTPADCSYAGINHFCDEYPTLVMSGINHGPNLGNDIFYSGTVAGAREGCMHGIPSVAFSLSASSRAQQLHWETAATVVRSVWEKVQQTGMPPRRYVNVNIPNIPLEDFRGYKLTGLGDRQYFKSVERRTDPRGGEYVWIGGGLVPITPEEGTDIWAVENGYASITAITLDVADSVTLDGLREWER